MCIAFTALASYCLYLTAGTSVVMSFHHLPFFNVTCATVTSITLAKSLQPDKSYYIDKTSFLHCLYEGDSGRTSPNALVSSQIRKFGGDNFSSAVRKYGFPFKVCIPLPNNRYAYVSFFSFWSKASKNESY